MKRKLLSIIALNAILFISCGDNTDPTPEINDRQVRFSSGVEVTNSLRISGMDGDTWSTLDRIGIYMLENGQPLAAQHIVNTGDNVSYKPVNEAKSTELSVTEGFDPIYYPEDGSKVDFLAYYPYQASLTDFIYPVDLSNQLKQNDLYILASKRADNGGAGYDNTNTLPVNLLFDHQLVKVLINVTKGDDVPDLSGLEVKIKGMNTKAGFSLVDKSISQMNTPADIIPYHNETTDQYEAVLLPLETITAAHVVEFTIGEDTYSWTMSDNTGIPGSIDKLEAAQKYTFSVKLQKNQVEVSVTINAWDSVGAVDGMAT